MATYPATASASNGSTHSPATSLVAGGSEVNDIQLVFQADILILALCFSFAIVSIPRAFARIYAVDWRKGHFLRFILPVDATTRIPQVALARSDTNDSELEKKVDVESSNDSHTTLTPHENLMNEDLATDKGQTEQKSPPHVPAFSTFLHPISSVLSYRVISGFSYGQALILAIYSAILGYLSLYKTNLISNPDRCD